jgi:peptide-methionine (S)-S-oxide reductase
MVTTHSGVRRAISIAAILGAVVVVGVGLRTAGAAEKARVIPPPAQDESAGQATSEVAVLAGGCFWGVQGVYQHVKGVDKALSGYAGGAQRTARYAIVGWGNTGHAESVQVTFDPRQITYGKILQIFFSVVHDPTQLNRQGPDTGTQYRSAIFPASEEQTVVAKAYVAQLSQARVFDAAIVTKIELDRPFFPAEDYHQDYLKRHPSSPYIIYNDLPKISDLKRVFPELYRAAPVLVNGTK